VCAGFITLLVISYKGYSPSLVRARSQEVLEVVFAGALCYTGLTDGVTPYFTRKTECISRVRQDQYTHT
jgi:hypothetical protein